MTTTNLATLDRRFRKLDDAWEAARARGDAAEISRTWRLSQDAHGALYNAAPQSLQDVVVVLKRVIAGIDPFDPLADDLIPRLRRLRAMLGRRRAIVGVQDIVELRDIARASEPICDGGGKMPWLAAWLAECAACLSRPRLV